MEFDVFLSYSRKDSEMMRRVRDDLRAAGLRVWTDETLEPGTETWEAEVEGAIRASQILVVLLSPDAHASEWVRNEITLADALQRRIIPVLLRGQQGESIPLRLIASQWIDARADYDHASAMLITAIKNHGARSHQAPTLRMSRRRGQPDTPETAQDEAQEAAQEVAQAGGVRIPLIVGVVATMAMFALVALAVILANPPDTATTPEATVELTSTPETPTDSPTSQASPEASATVELTGHIAFVSNRDDELYNIFLLDLARGRTQLLWTNPYTEAYVSWSPDGSLLTFTSWTEPDFAGDIYTLRPSDNQINDLTDSDSVEDRFARWSPDGRQLVYESVTDDNIDLFVM
ncbi:MAG: TIR domain-containing protein, partial [Anaerolineae bacterium]